MPLNKELPIAISMGEPGGINIEIVLKCIKSKKSDSLGKWNYIYLLLVNKSK